MRILLVDSSHIFGIIYSVSGQAEHPNIKEFFRSCAFSVKKAVREIQPNYVLVAIDDYQTSWRKNQNTKYIQSSFEMPIAFANNLSIYRDMLSEFNMLSISVPGMESKDIIATICKKMEKAEDSSIYILSNNKRYYPILRDGITLRNNFGRDSFIEKTSASIKSQYNVTPEQMHAIQLLCGDKHIGLDGVKGIGEKTAIEVIQPYKNAAELIENAYKIEGKRGENIRLTFPSIVEEFSSLLLPKNDLALGCSLNSLLYKKANKMQSNAA